MAFAPGGEAALAMMEAAPFDVIVSDMRMPGMDGMTLVKQLRADPLTPGIAILMLTSETSVAMEEQALAVGADDYILKPVEPWRLAARVKAALCRSKTKVPINSD
jgi:DNA-binding response OmpR family regulator